MLDKVRKAVVPGSLQTERDDIQAQLDGLAPQLQDLILRRGVIVMGHEFTSGERSVVREARDLGKAIDDMEMLVKRLRSRRREIDQLFIPPTPVKEAIVTVEQPEALLAVQRDLDDARAARARLIEEGQRADENQAGKIAVKIAEVEGRIASLREQRAREFAPYHAALAAALQPIAIEAGSKLLEGIRAAKAAIATLGEVAAASPNVPGLPVWALVTINLNPLSQLEEFAANLASQEG